MADTRVGFIGIGAMGSRMAANLARAGHPLVVRDADPAKQNEFVAAHQARAATSLADLGGNSDVLICMLPTGPDRAPGCSCRSKAGRWRHRSPAAPLSST